jgi:hypothetical protein
MMRTRAAAVTETAVADRVLIYLINHHSAARNVAATPRRPINHRTGDASDRYDVRQVPPRNRDVFPRSCTETQLTFSTRIITVFCHCDHHNILLIHLFVVYVIINIISLFLFVCLHKYTFCVTTSRSCFFFFYSIFNHRTATVHTHTTSPVCRVNNCNCCFNYKYL